MNCTAAIALLLALAFALTIEASDRDSCEYHGARSLYHAPIGHASHQDPSGYHGAMSLYHAPIGHASQQDPSGYHGAMSLSHAPIGHASHDGAMSLYHAPTGHASHHGAMSLSHTPMGRASHQNSFGYPSAMSFSHTPMGRASHQNSFGYPGAMSLSHTPIVLASHLNSFGYPGAMSPSHAPTGHASHHGAMSLSHTPIAYTSDHGTMSLSHTPIGDASDHGPTSPSHAPTGHASDHGATSLSHAPIGNAGIRVPYRYIGTPPLPQYEPHEINKAIWGKFRLHRETHEGVSTWTVHDSFSPNNAIPYYQKGTLQYSKIKRRTRRFMLRHTEIEESKDTVYYRSYQTTKELYNRYCSDHSNDIGKKLLEFVSFPTRFRIISDDWFEISFFEPDFPRRKVKDILAARRSQPDNVVMGFIPKITLKVAISLVYRSVYTNFSRYFTRRDSESGPGPAYEVCLHSGRDSMKTSPWRIVENAMRVVHDNFPYFALSYRCGFVETMQAVTKEMTFKFGTKDGQPVTIYVVAAVVDPEGLRQLRIQLRTSKLLRHSVPETIRITLSKMFHVNSSIAKALPHGVIFYREGIIKDHQADDVHNFVFGGASCFVRNVNGSYRRGSTVFGSCFVDMQEGDTHTHPSSSVESSTASKAHVEFDDRELMQLVFCSPGVPFDRVSRQLAGTKSEKDIAKALVSISGTFDLNLAVWAAVTPFVAGTE